MSFDLVTEVVVTAINGKFATPLGCLGFVVYHAGNSDLLITTTKVSKTTASKL